MKQYKLLFLFFIVLGMSSCLKNEFEELEQQEAQARKEYIEENDISTTPTASGLYYIEQILGTGAQAKSGDIVQVHYTGYLLDGTKFDSSYDRNEALEFTLGIGQVIAGWDEGIAYMREGGEARLIIPSHLAYGTTGASSAIPAYSTIIFDVKLISIVD